MSHKVYRLDPGQCTCFLGDPIAGPQRTGVLRIGGTGILLKPSGSLHPTQFVYSEVKLADGPSLALSGVVAFSTPAGAFIEWSHSSPREAEKLDRSLREYLVARGKDPTVLEEQLGSHGGPPAPGEKSVDRKATPAAPAGQPKEMDGAGRNAARAHAADARAAAEASRVARSAPPPARPVAGPGPEATREPPPPPKKPPARPPAPATDTTKPPRITQPLSSVRAPEQARSRVQAPAAREDESDFGDVAQNIRRKARTVRSADLASRLETVQVLDIGNLKGLIREAVDESVKNLDRSLAEEEKKRLLEEAEEAFRERMERYQAEKAGLEEKALHLQKELEKTREVLEEERQRVVSASQFTVSDKGMVELEQRLGRMLDFALRKGKVTPEFEKEMRAVVSRLLDDEREQIQAQARKAQSDRIALLEKKLQRIATSLETAEHERDRAQRRAQALEAAGGMPLRNLLEAGLDEDDPDRERKLSLLKEIAEKNRQIRDELQKVGRLPPKRVIQEAEEPSLDAAPLVDGPGGADGAVSREEESELARSLGVVKREPSLEGESPADEAGEAAPEEAESEEKEESGTDKVPILTDEESANPDDLPWEPPPEGRPEEKDKFKRLGG